MSINDHSQLYKELRCKHPELVYENYTINYKRDDLFIEFLFTMTGDIEFRPSLHIPATTFFRPENIPENLLRNLVFHIGMIELISYWKTACPPKIIIKPHKLNEEQIEWWKNLYYNGMGEFFFLNNIAVDYNSFLNLYNSKNGAAGVGSSRIDLSDGIIIPVGGGKDSVVTLELLKNHCPSSIPLVINHRLATLQTIECAGFKPEDVLVINRELDKTMLDLNEKGYLNGHTPFSALLAFVTLLASAGSKVKYVALSNESSANDATIPGTNINHQYSKSYEFEKDFRNYVAKYICPEMEYFSFLRPFNELQIAALFAGYRKYHRVFKSCNAGSKSDIWCCNCSKCLFVFIILLPFLDPGELKKIFGENLLEKPGLKKYFDELTGISEYKPFECVGTVEEVNVALCIAIEKYYDIQEKPVLIKHYMESEKYNHYFNSRTDLLSTVSSKHFVPERFIGRLMDNLPTEHR